jgi:hypothetical protein
MEAAVPHTPTNPADEIIATAMQRIGNRLLQAASNAEPFSALRTCAAMGAVRVHFGHNSIVEDREVTEAVELIREINDVLEIAPNEARDALRRTRVDLEELIDRREWQIQNRAAFEARDSIRSRVAARIAALETKVEG